MQAVPAGATVVDGSGAAGRRADVGVDVHAEPVDDAIMAIAPDGSGLTLIGDPVDTIADLDWSPAGDQLLFVCRAVSPASMMLAEFLFESVE